MVGALYDIEQENPHILGQKVDSTMGFEPFPWISNLHHHFHSISIILPPSAFSHWKRPQTPKIYIFYLVIVDQNDWIGDFDANVIYGSKFWSYFHDCSWYEIVFAQYERPTMQIQGIRDMDLRYGHLGFTYFVEWWILYFKRSRWLV